MARYFVYIMSSPSGTLYTGITSDLEKRVYEHKSKQIEGFTKKYNVTRLVFFEETDDVSIAIEREKEIKGWRRSKKVELIESLNPQWKDLSDDCLRTNWSSAESSITIVLGIPRQSKTQFCLARNDIRNMHLILEYGEYFA